MLHEVSVNSIRLSVAAIFVLRLNIYMKWQVIAFYNTATLRNFNYAVL